MSKIEKYSGIIGSLDFEKSVSIEGRTFLGPDEIIKQIKELEDLYQIIKDTDILKLYSKSIAHDGVSKEDLSYLGKYYAYLSFELRGQSISEKEENLEKALGSLVDKYGKDKVLKYFPKRIKGREITTHLHIKPEDDEYPSYYSESKKIFAEKMAQEEIPAAVLEQIQNDQDILLDKYDWSTLYVVDPKGRLLDTCGNIYLVPESQYQKVEPFTKLWNIFLEKGFDSFYDHKIATDGIHPPDEAGMIGRYYAYVKLESKGLSGPEKLELLEQNFPEKLTKSMGLDKIKEIFPLELKGDAITQNLTIRPEDEEYPAHYNEKKLERGERRLERQIHYNIQANIIKNVEEMLGDIKKVIILTKP